MPHTISFTSDLRSLGICELVFAVVSLAVHMTRVLTPVSDQRGFDDGRIWSTEQKLRFSHSYEVGFMSGKIPTKEL